MPEHCLALCSTPESWPQLCGGYSSHHCHNESFHHRYLHVGTWTPIATPVPFMLILQSTAVLFTTLDFYSLPIPQAHWQPRRSAPSRQASHWPLVCFLSKVGPFSQATWSCFPAQLHSAALLSQRALFCPALCLPSCFRGIYPPLFKNILEVYSFRSRSKKTPPRERMEFPLSDLVPLSKFHRLSLQGDWQ